jgi:predicted enzyme related to lactoylglutathione lyase
MFIHSAEGNLASAVIAQKLGNLLGDVARVMRSSPRSSGVLGVDIIEVTLDEVIELGAEAMGAIEDVGEATRMVRIRVPMGEVFGLIENPNFKADAPPTPFDGPGR